MKTVLKSLFFVVVLFAATAPALADEEAYTICPGDVLQISVWKEDALDREVVVLPDGSVNFPLVDTISVKDKTPAAVQLEINKKLAKFVPDASVSVVVKADLGHTVSVIGQVAKPGELIMGHHLTVMQALSQAGGLTPYASEHSIIILRKVDGRETSIPFRYSSVASGEDLEQDITLTPGDVVVVPTTGLL